MKPAPKEQHQSKRKRAEPTDTTVKLGLEPERLAGVEVAQPLPMTWQQPAVDGLEKPTFLPLKRISETS